MKTVGPELGPELGSEGAGTGRWRQRRRTRKDLLEAAARLMKQGRPTIEAVADAAHVSRATAYRYFPTVEALLTEASLDLAMPDPEAVLGGQAGGDAVSRLERIDDALQAMMAENEVPLRLMLANALEQRARDGHAGGLPVRQDRRTPLIAAALEPLRDQLPPEDLDDLVAALALVIGTEAMIVFRDVLQMDDARAQRVRRWAIRTLVTAARDGQGA